MWREKPQVRVNTADWARKFVAELKLRLKAHKYSAIVQVGEPLERWKGKFQLYVGLIFAPNFRLHLHVDEAKSTDPEYIQKIADTIIALGEACYGEDLREDDES